MASEKTQPAAAPSPARSALLRLAEAIRLAQAERDAAARECEPLAEPAQRLLALIARHRAGLAELGKTSDDAAYEQSLTALMAVEREIAELRGSVDMLAYRTAEEALRQANEGLARLALQREELHWLAAQEAAEAFVHEHLVPIYAQALRVRGAVDLLAHAIAARGHGNSPSASARGIGQAILRKVAETIGAIRVPGNRIEAEQFLVRLGEDPTAELKPPAYEAEYSLDPIRTMACPIPDGSQFINREKASVEPAQRVLPAAAVTQQEDGTANTANSPMPAEAVPGPTFGPMAPPMPPWLTGGSAWSR